MNKSIGHYIWESFKKVWGVPAIFLGIVLSYLSWTQSPDSTIKLSFFVLILSTLVIVIITLINLSINLYNKSIENKLPIIKLTRQPFYDDNSQLLLLLEPSDLFSFDSVVSIYKLDNDFEQLFGIGKVINIQENGMIQVGLIEVIGSGSETFKKLANNDKELLEKMIIKPTIPNFAFNSLQT